MENNEKSMDALKKEVYQNDPVDYLLRIKKAKGSYITLEEKMWLRKLIADPQIPDSIINMASNYLYVVQGLKSTGKARFNGIVEDWMEKGLDTPEKVIKYMKSKSEKKNVQEQNQAFNWTQNESRMHKKTSGNYKSKYSRTEKVPDFIKKSEDEEVERKIAIQEEYFAKAYELKNGTYEDKVELYKKANKVDTYRMPEGSRFTEKLANIMELDMEKYIEDRLKDFS